MQESPSLHLPTLSHGSPMLKLTVQCAATSVSLSSSTGYMHTGILLRFAQTRDNWKYVSVLVDSFPNVCFQSIGRFFFRTFWVDVISAPACLVDVPAVWLLPPLWIFLQFCFFLPEFPQCLKTVLEGDLVLQSVPWRPPLGKVFFYFFVNVRVFVLCQTVLGILQFLICKNLGRKTHSLPQREAFVGIINLLE